MVVPTSLGFLELLGEGGMSHLGRSMMRLNQSFPVRTDLYFHMKAGACVEASNPCSSVASLAGSCNATHRWFPVSRLGTHLVPEILSLIQLIMRCQLSPRALPLGRDTHRICPRRSWKRAPLRIKMSAVCKIHGSGKQGQSAAISR